ncbi:translocation protein Sec62-domain-containing protein, partial [Umbelopsis sp. AD052]
MSHQHGPNCNHDHEQEQTQQVRTIQVSEPSKAPADVHIAAQYLKDPKKSGMKQRFGVLNGKRFEYFKGRRLVTTREEAHQLLLDLGVNGFILHVDRGESPGGKGTPRALQPNQLQAINEDWYYMWIWEGSQVKLYIGAAALVATVLAAVMFPLWPSFLRLGVWYLSVGVLGLLGVFFGIAIIRLILFVLTMFTLSPGIWLFPNLFEDVGIVDSFIPFWGWDEPKKKKSKAETETGAAESS